MKKCVLINLFIWYFTPALLFAKSYPKNYVNTSAFTLNRLDFDAKLIIDSSLYKIEKIPIKSTEFCLISIKVFEKDWVHHFPFAICVFRDKKYHPLLSVNSDKEGAIELKVSDFIHLRTLSITSVGYHSVDIPINALKGHHNAIFVALSPDLTHPLE
ncbi:MAG: hypothetical protein ACKOWL_05575 [Sphingobacteriaceae bacterium]